MSGKGDLQEQHAKEFIQRLGYHHIIWGDDNIRGVFALPDSARSNPKCADIIGFGPSMANPIAAVVCESKGTEVDKAVIQLGNAAAGLLDYLAAHNMAHVEITLLLYREKLTKLYRENLTKEDAVLSPGPGYVVGDRDRNGFYVLMDEGNDDRKKAPAHPSVEMERLNIKLHKWGRQVSKLLICVYVERGLAQHIIGR